MSSSYSSNVSLDPKRAAELAAERAAEYHRRKQEEIRRKEAELKAKQQKLGNSIDILSTLKTKYIRELDCISRDFNKINIAHEDDEVVKSEIDIFESFYSEIADKITNSIKNEFYLININISNNIDTLKKDIDKIAAKIKVLDHNLSKVKKKYEESTVDIKKLLNRRRISLKEQSENLEFIKKIRIQSEKAASFDESKIVFISKNTDTVIQNEFKKVLNTLKRDIRFFLKQDQLLSNEKVKAEEILRKVIAFRIDECENLDVVQTCHFSFLELKKSTSRRIENMLDKYDRYVYECEYAGLKPNPFDSFPSEVALDIEQKIIKEKNDMAYQRKYIEDVINEVMTGKYKCSIVREKKAPNKRKRERTLFGFGKRDRALNVFVSLEGNLTMAVVATGTNEGLSYEERHSVCRDHEIFFNNHPELLDEFRARGLTVNNETQCEANIENVVKVLIADNDCTNTSRGNGATEPQRMEINNDM